MRRPDTPSSSYLIASARARMKPKPQKRAARYRRAPSSAAQQTNRPASTALGLLGLLAFIAITSSANQLYPHQQADYATELRPHSIAAWDDEVAVQESRLAELDDEQHEAPDRKPAAHISLYQNDPFEATFEGFLKDAPEEGSSSNSNSNSSEQPVAPASPPPTENIDVVFPASAEHKAESPGARPLFAWHQLPSNKCSRACGRGFKVKRLACFDLKYDVKVEDELCERAKLAKPIETSDESCNEIDCAPEWTEVEYQECKSPAGWTGDDESAPEQNGRCRTTRFKRLQCSMLDKRGHQIYLEDWQCESATAGADNKPAPGVDFDESVDVESLSQLDSLNNDIPTSGSDASSRSEDQPHFEVGQWSACLDGGCDQLGRRTRNLTCQMSLSRSQTPTELSLDACHHLARPHTEEPCYVDCHAPAADLDDDLIYDAEMSRFVWRQEGWTKCSAECLGGRREALIECWDKQTESVVEASQCEEGLRPAPLTETCNENACSPEWQPGAWSACSRSCGSTGVRSRPLTCIQRVPGPSANSSQLAVVSSDVCLDPAYNLSMPDRTEPCNRDDCQPEWTVGPWSNCSRACGVGLRNRTVICVREYASPPPIGKREHKLADLYSIGAAVQIPYHICLDHYKIHPPLEEVCVRPCPNQPYIDVDPLQQHRVDHASSKRRHVNVKIGGRAEVLEGKNLKIRCKVVNRNESSHEVEWLKDGLPIFERRDLAADRENFNDENNYILGPETPMMSANSRASKDASKDIKRWRRQHTYNQKQHAEQSDDNHDRAGKLFGDRFVLLRSNSLRIRRMRPSDSGRYTCIYGSLRESIEVHVLKSTSKTDSITKD